MNSQLTSETLSSTDTFSTFDETLRGLFDVDTGEILEPPVGDQTSKNNKISQKKQQQPLQAKGGKRKQLPQTPKTEQSRVKTSKFAPPQIAEPASLVREEVEEGEVVEEEEGYEQGISVPEGHWFLGDWRGVTVKQMFGSVVAGLVRYQMKKSPKTGAPLVGRDGKILTQCSKWEFTLKEAELMMLYKMIPQVIAKMRQEQLVLDKYRMGFQHDQAAKYQKYH